MTEENKSGLTDEARAEIQAAVKILREDGVHIHKTYERYFKTKVDKGSETGDKLADAGEKLADADKGDGQKPPPEKETPNEDTPPSKRGLWWGDKSDD